MQKGLLAFLLYLPSILFGQVYTAPEMETLLIETCTGTIYDAGGAERDYTNDNESLIVIDASEGNYIELTFTDFEVESIYGNL